MSLRRSTTPLSRIRLPKQNIPNGATSGSSGAAAAGGTTGKRDFSRLLTVARLQCSLRSRLLVARACIIGGWINAAPYTKYRRRGILYFRCLKRPTIKSPSGASLMTMPDGQPPPAGWVKIRPKPVQHVSASTRWRRCRTAPLRAGCAVYGQQRGRSRCRASAHEGRCGATRSQSRHFMERAGTPATAHVHRRGFCSIKCPPTRQRRFNASLAGVHVRRAVKILDGSAAAGVVMRQRGAAPGRRRARSGMLNSEPPRSQSTAAVTARTALHRQPQQQQADQQHDGGLRRVHQAPCPETGRFRARFRSSIAAA